MIKILIIDDNPDNLISLKAIIADSFPGTILLTSTDGRDGIKLAAKENPDLIFLDILMPVMDGFETCKRLKQHESTQNIPVVFITSLREDKKIRIKAIEAGAEAFLTKPFDEAELIVQIKAMVKIKKASDILKEEKEHLELLVLERTSEIERSQLALLNLMEDLKYENEARKNSEYALKNIEEETRKNNQLLRAILESPQGIIIFSLDTKYRYTSFTVLHKETMKKLWNVTIEVGMSILEAITNPQDREKAKTNFDRCYQGEHFILIEDYGDITLNRIYYEDRYSPMYSDDNQIIGLTVFVTDISKRRKVETLLLEKEQKYRLLYESAGVGIGYYSPEGKIISFNNIAALHMNGKPEDFVGKTQFDIFPFETAQFFHQRLMDSIASEVSLQFEDKVELPLNTKWFQSVFNKIKDKDGNLSGIQIISTDISRIKESEEALIESEARFRNLLENVSSVSVQGYGMDGTTKYWNEASERLYGYSAKEAIGQNLLDLIIPSEMQSEVRLAIQHMIDTGQPVPPDQLSLKRKDGSRVTVFSSHAIVQNPGKSPELFCIDIDLTERERADQALKDSEANLRELNSTKDKFFSIIAHDLKSPFNAILGFSDILIDQIMTKDYEGIEEYASIIQNSAQHAMDLLTNLFVWSHSQTGRMEFNPEYIELVDLIENIIQLSKDSAVHKSIDIAGNLPHNATIFADKAMISSILRNLISNAVKFTRRGGQIKVSLQNDPKEMLVSVRDNGVGIGIEEQKMLFRIDESYSTTGTSNEKGTGLGLLLCKEFVSKHGGKIWVESIPENGSTFYFSIPKRELIF